MSLIKQYPTAELPRERLMRDGVDALSIQELLAILLGTGTHGKTVLDLSQELLLHFGGTEGLLQASVAELQQFKGIGSAKAILLKAAFGIALRAKREKLGVSPLVRSIQDVLEIAVPQIGDLKKEAVLIILRDVKCRLIRSEVISLGTLSEVLVHPREVFQIAIRHGAYSLVICHNHPSGDPTPSEEDITLTKKLDDCAKLVGIPLVDHIIIGRDNFISMHKQGYL